MKVVVVTGSVASGKSTLSRKLAKKFGFEYVDVNKIITDNKLSSGYDEKRKCKVIDVKRLNRSLISFINKYKKPRINKSILEKKLKNNKIPIIKNSNNKKTNKNNLKNKEMKGMVIDSHLSHYLSKKYVDLCIITKCGIKELNKRLKKRRYSSDKVKENIECEIFDVCLDEAKEKGHNVVVITTTKAINMSEISKRIR